MYSLRWWWHLITLLNRTPVQEKYLEVALLKPSVTDRSPVLNKEGVYSKSRVVDPSLLVRLGVKCVVAAIIARDGRFARVDGMQQPVTGGI